MRGEPGLLLGLGQTLTLIAAQEPEGLPRRLSVKNPPANAGEVGSSLGWDYPLEEEMATQSSILAWEIPWMEEPGGPQFMRLQRDMTEQQITASRYRPVA